MSAPLKKQVAESRRYSMDFSANMETTETIASITSVVATPSGLTLGAASIDGQRVRLTISGGTDNVRYKLTFTIVTSGPQTLVANGDLLVQNQ